MDNLLAAAGPAQSVNWTLEITKMVVSVVVVLLGLWVWHRQKRCEPRYDSLKYLTQKRLDSLLKAWSLLAYMTEVENAKSVLVWKEDSNGKTFFIRPEQAKAYINELSDIFYGSGCGLLLKTRVKDLCYEYRSQLYGVLLSEKEKQHENDMILVENAELVKRAKEIYAALNDELRNELKKIEK